MIINLGCTWVDNHIPLDDIFDDYPLRECNIYRVFFCFELKLISDFVFLQAVVPKKEVQRPRSDSDSTSTGSFDVGTGVRSPSPDSGCHSDWNFRQRSITPVDSAVDTSKPSGVKRTDSDSSFVELVDTENGMLEIIRVQKHGGTHKHRKRKKKKPVIQHLEEDLEITEETVKSNPGKKVVEIPSIEEVTLADAASIEISDSDFQGLDHVSQLPRCRSPGDGRENGDTLMSINGTNKQDSFGQQDVCDQTDRSLNNIKPNLDKNMNKFNHVSNCDQANLQDNANLRKEFGVSSVSEKGDTVKDNKSCDNAVSASDVVDGMSSSAKCLLGGVDRNGSPNQSVQYGKCNANDLCNTSEQDSHMTSVYSNDSIGDDEDVDSVEIDSNINVNFGGEPGSNFSKHAKSDSISSDCDKIPSYTKSSIFDENTQKSSAMSLDYNSENSQACVQETNNLHDDRKHLKGETDDLIKPHKDSVFDTPFTLDKSSMSNELLRDKGKATQKSHHRNDGTDRVLESRVSTNDSSAVEVQGMYSDGVYHTDQYNKDGISILSVTSHCSVLLHVAGSWHVPLSGHNDVALFE